MLATLHRAREHACLGLFMLEPGRRAVRNFPVLACMFLPQSSSAFLAEAYREIDMALAWAVSLVSGEVARQQHQLLAVAANEKPHTQVPPSVFSCTSGLSSTASADAPFTFGKGLLVFVQLSKVGSTSMRYMLYDAYGKAFSFYGCASRCALEPR